MMSLRNIRNLWPFNDWKNQRNCLRSARAIGQKLRHSNITLREVHPWIAELRLNFLELQNKSYCRSCRISLEQIQDIYKLYFCQFI